MKLQIHCSINDHLSKHIVVTVATVLECLENTRRKTDFLSLSNFFFPFAIHFRSDDIRVVGAMRANVGYSGAIDHIYVSTIS